MKHTPGPWRVDAVLPVVSQGHTFATRISIVAHSAEFNADIRIADIPDVEAGADYTEPLATATLMAEAAEMFELFRELYENQGAAAWTGNDDYRARFVALMARLGVVPPKGPTV